MSQAPAKVQNQVLDMNPNQKPAKLTDMENNLDLALQTVDDIVLKNYLPKLESLDVVPLSPAELEEDALDKISLFKITEMVYAKDEYATNKFASVFNALSTLRCGVFIIMDSDGTKTDFYMGINVANSSKDIKTLDSTLKNAIQGQFPGVGIESYPLKDNIRPIIDKIPNGHISSVSCVANVKDTDTRENRFFIQGLEKLALAMQGKKYTGIILANGTTQDQLNEIRRGYETIYTQLAPFANGQLTFTSSNSMSVSQSTAIGKSVSETLSENYSKTHTQSTSTTKTVSKNGSATSKIAFGLAAAAGVLGVALAPVTGGASAAAAAAGIGKVMAASAASAGFSAIGSAFNKQVSSGTTEQKSEAETVGTGKSRGETNSNTQTDTQGTTVGMGQNMTYNLQNKTIIDILARLDAQLRRLDEFESLGMWECSAYFLSAPSEKINAEVAAATYKALMSGEHSGIEASAINSWHDYDEKTGQKKTQLIGQYIKRLSHPVFNYSAAGQVIPVTPVSMVSGNELALHMGLPRHSVCGLPVIEHASFGKEVNYDGHGQNGETVKLGKVREMGRDMTTEVRLDKERFSMHTFVTGSTGSGKSNAVYLLLSKLSRMGINFMVIEPAKGEYKNVFGNKPGIKVYGTNPVYAALLQINPFRFPKGIHILEHVDRLIEIFNVCWPMYAAMPAVLKAAVLQAYESCGWDLDTSINEFDTPLYPTFADLQNEIINVVESSAYSSDSKGDYIGSLATRVESLTNGLNGQIFSAKEIPDAELFDRNVIIDLSRVASLETKALMMGILIMRLNEYRMSSADGMNQPLKHITVLEEAHNILKRTSSEQNSDAPSIAGKSVEMLSNSIAEMRTYGEGFIIADQSPNAVDLSAIRNTNTKIILRLPDASDRELAGKAAALKDDQLEEIAKLPKGVAVVYQNDWLEPVLCHIDRFDVSEKPYRYTPIPAPKQKDDTWFRTQMLKLLIKGRLPEQNEISIDISEIKEALSLANIPVADKMDIIMLLNEYSKSGKLALWEDDNFGELSQKVVNLLSCRKKVKRAILLTSNISELNGALGRLVGGLTTYLNKRELITVTQCLIRDYVMDNPDKQDLYKEWRELTLSNARRNVLK